MTIPQLHGMYNGDYARKRTLVDYGFRLPSALDNRPLMFDEIEQRINQVIYVSATPGPFELQCSQRVVEQVIRPTGLLDPTVEVKPTHGQIDDLVEQVRARANRGERCLVTTLTKRMAEELTDYLREANVKVHYLHSEIDTLQRSEILRDLRLGVYDVVVGINLLREGLDLPETSLVLILDADKEGYLRSASSLIQTAGRAARHVDGHVIMYGDRLTAAMKQMIEETGRRRSIQQAHNRSHGITPEGIRKEIRDITQRVRDVTQSMPSSYARGDVATDRLPRIVKELESDMLTAARRLEFEKAALLRDELTELKRLLGSEQVAKTGSGGREHAPPGRSG